MPNILIWRGDAQGVRQKVVVTIANPESGDQFHLTINRKTLTVTADEDGTMLAAGTDSDANLSDDVYRAFVSAVGQYSNTIAEFAEITSEVEQNDDNVATSLILYGPVDGKPFTITGSTTNRTGGLDVLVSTVVEGDPGANEKQQVKISGTATGGTFTLTFDGQTTGNIAYDASAATVETALEALSNIDSGDVDVTGSAGGPWTVEFLQQYANVNVPEMTGDGTNITKDSSGYAVVVQTIQQGDAGLNEIQHIRLAGPPASGTFTLTFDSQETGNIDFDATAAEMQTALEALSNIASGDVAVTQPAAFEYRVEFKGTYANANVNLLTADGENLGGGASGTVTEKTKGSAGTNERQDGFFNWFRGTGAGATITHPDTGQSAVMVFDTIFPQGEPFENYFPRMRDFFETELGFGFGNIACFSGQTFSSDPNHPNFSIRVIYQNAWGATNVEKPTVDATYGSTVVCTFSTNQQGDSTTVDEVQRVALFGALTGDFTLTFLGATTAAIAFDASAAAVKSALEALSSITAVTVTSVAGGWDVEFNTPGASDVPLMTIDDAGLNGGAIIISTDQEPTPGANEVQRVTIAGGPAGGTFTLTWDGDATGNIDFDASSAAVKAALEAITSTPTVTVTGNNGGPWTITFTDPGKQNVPQMTGDGSSLSGADILVSTVRDSLPAFDDVQQLALLGTPTGGTFTLTFDGQTTGAIPFNATPAELQAELEGLSNIDVGELAVTGGQGGPWTVTFVGTAGATDQNEFTGDGGSLTTSDSQTITLTTDTDPTGPNWFDNANNWQTVGSSTANAPATGDTIIFQDNSVDCLYGLDASALTVAEWRQFASYTGHIGLAEHNGFYYEYRDKYLAIGATLVNMGQGDGTGSPRTRLDFGSVQAEINVHATGQSEDDLPAFVWLGTHASNVCRVSKGTVGLAVGGEGGDAKVATLTIGYKDSQDSDAIVSIGSGVTQVTTIEQLGGELAVQSGSSLTVGTWRKFGGSAVFGGDGACTSLVCISGRLDWESDGAITTLEIGPTGEVYFTRDLRARTVGTVTLQAGATLIDSQRTVTFTNPIILDNCGLPQVTLDVGPDVNLAVAVN